MTNAPMNITNNTQWDTNDLRKLIQLTYKNKGYDYWRKDIYIEHSSNGDYHGTAMINGTGITMKVPHPHTDFMYMQATGKDGKPELWTIKRYVKGKTIVAKCSRIFDSVKFSQILIHEEQHNQGLKHPDQAPWWKIPVPWAEGFIVHPKPPAKPKPKTKLEEKRDHAQAMLAMHERKWRKEGTLVEKWTKEVAKLERKVAAKKRVAEGETDYCQVCGGLRDTKENGTRHISFPKGGSAEPCKWCIKWLKGD